MREVMSPDGQDVSSTWCNDPAQAEPNTDGPLGPRQSPPPAKRGLLSLRPPDTLEHILMPQGSHREGVDSIR